MENAGTALRLAEYWEILAETLSASGWRWGYCRVATANGSHYIVGAYCGDGCRFIVESDELLTALLELEATVL